VPKELLVFRAHRELKVFQVRDYKALVVYKDYLVLKVCRGVKVCRV
jgi:hypothetical protein